jgi:phosphoglycolate phosphatase-like HAD superfamily hydrolase
MGIADRLIGQSRLRLLWFPHHFSYLLIKGIAPQEKHGYECVIMVGDGVTDMEAKPPAAAFIGFGGKAVREKVKAGADWFVTDFNDLIQALR